MADVKNKVLETIKKYNLISNNDKIVVRCFRWAGLYLPFGCIKENKRGKNIRRRKYKL